MTSAPAGAQAQVELKRFNPQFVSEPGCPVEVVSASTEMEMDPFGTPVAARHYIDYRNTSGRPITAVKFRIGYVADDGRIHQPYLNGFDKHDLQPGEQASQKWRGDKVDPRTAAIKMRVLKVSFADGSIWESAKAGETNTQQQQGFAPLTIESADNDGERSAGTPVPLRDYGQTNYRGYPERTDTGAVPLSTPPTTGTGAPYAANAFGTGRSSSAASPNMAAPGADAFNPEGSAGAQPAHGSAAWGSGGSGTGAQTAGAVNAFSGGNAAINTTGSAGAWRSNGSEQPASASGAAGGSVPAGSGWGTGAPAPANFASTASGASGATTKAAEPPLPADPMAALDQILGTTPKPAKGSSTTGGAPAPGIGGTSVQTPAGSGGTPSPSGAGTVGGPSGANSLGAATSAVPSVVSPAGASSTAASSAAAGAPSPGRGAGAAADNSGTATAGQAVPGADTKSDSSTDGLGL